MAICLFDFFSGGVFIYKNMEVTRATAGRYIAQLAKDKKLRNISIPRNPIYEPMPGFYGKEKLPEPENETENVSATNDTDLTIK